MIKDLSKQIHSATSTFINILPMIEDLRFESMDEQEKINKAKRIVVENLCKQREHHGVSQEYIIQVKKTIERQKRLTQVIEYINNAIEKGKNYVEDDKE